ncbi:MAG: glycerophosphodiester phosphodiesterase family protein [Bacteroidota bacterium]
MRKIQLLHLVLIFLFGCQNYDDSKLIEEFRVTNSENIPKISAHRGGKGIKGFPENCLETMKHLHEQLDALYEVDISETKDGLLVLMHDNSIDRTTNGLGLVRSKTWSELKELVLIDDFGEQTSYKIPLLDEVLTWAKNNNAVLTLDIKKGVGLKKVVNAVKKKRAQDHCILITYSLEQALNAHEIAPELMLSVSARNDRELESLLSSKIPTRNMIAFTGTRLSPKDLYIKLSNNNILSMLGALGNLDRMAAARGDHLYKHWRALGINIIATDRPIAVNKILKK